MGNGKKGGTLKKAVCKEACNLTSVQNLGSYALATYQTIGLRAQGMSQTNSLARSKHLPYHWAYHTLGNWQTNALHAPSIY
jgi:hypothetical protein